MKDRTHSQRLHLDIRRITLRNGRAYSVRPSFALPMMVGRVGEFANALFLRKFGVPLWALERVFGINATKLYRLELSIGRNSIVGCEAARAVWRMLTSFDSPCEADHAQHREATGCNVTLHRG